MPDVENNMAKEERGDSEKKIAGATDHLEHVQNPLGGGDGCFEGYSRDETERIVKRLVALVDLRVLPVLILLFIFNILDRSNIANAKVAGMATDLKLTGLDYNNLVVFAFLGYVLFQIPIGFFLNKGSPAVYLSCAVILWGICSMSCGFVQTYAQMSVVRVLVGATESPFFPGALLILSSFYTRKELAPRIALMYSGNSLANGFGGLLASGLISGLDGKAGLAGWRWLFIIEGVMTTVIGMACYVLLPSVPSKTLWLTEEQRRLAIWRSTLDASGSEDEADDMTRLEAVKLIFKDWKVLLLILQQTFISCSQSFTYFFPSIVNSLGYNATNTLLLTAPPYFFAFFLSIAVAFSSARFQETGYHIAVPMVVCCLGNALAVALPVRMIGPRYFAMFLLCSGSYCAFNLSFAWVSSTVPRPRVKRAASLSLVNALAAASHFFTPYMFPSSSAPRYIPGGIALAVFSIGVASMALIIKATLWRQNRKMMRLDGAGEPYVGSLEAIPKGYRFTL